MKINIGNKEVEFQADKTTGKVFCTSLDIARVFEKNHRDVLRVIDSILLEIRKIGSLEQERNFALSFYEHPLGNGASRKNKLYKLNRDSFSLIAMSFTGTRALEWKISFINAFNYMENELRIIKDNATATLEQPKEVFNLTYETLCRDAILKVVKDSEVQHNAKAKGIKEYTITEKMKKGKVYTNCQVGIEWDRPMLFKKEDLQCLTRGSVAKKFNKAK